MAASAANAMANCLCKVPQCGPQGMCPPVMPGMILYNSAAGTFSCGPTTPQLQAWINQNAGCGKPIPGTVGPLAPGAPVAAGASAPVGSGAPSSGETVYVYGSAAPAASGGASSSGFDLSSLTSDLSGLPWWAYALAAAVGLYMVVK